MNFKNLPYSTVATAPSPATSGTSLVVGAGEGARFPQPSSDGSFWATVFPVGENPSESNAEIVQVTARSTDTLTIVRAQRGTTAKSIAIGWIIIQGVYAEDLNALFRGPEGVLYNGKIVTSVSSNNLTVALKGVDGNDPSNTNPVFVRIGDSVRLITAALSVTKNAGTNWFQSGSADFATKEIDYFVYLGYNATDGVVIGFSRIPYATLYSHFSATTTNEKYAAISTITNAIAGNQYVNIGRFNAVLSATASFNWSIPATSIIINRPVFETRWLNNNPTVNGAGGSVGTYASDRSMFLYKIRYDSCGFVYGFRITNLGSWTGEVRVATPFAAAMSGTSYWPVNGLITANNTNPATNSRGYGVILDTQPSQVIFASNIWNSTLNWASMATNDVVFINGEYTINI